MSRTPVVSVRHLSHAFGKGKLLKPVLFDVDLEISAGEIVLLTGPSGSGKTTLPTLIAGLRSLQQGSVRILRRELSGASKKQLVQVRSRIGFIFQAHNLLASLTAQQNVGMSLRLHQQLSLEERISRSQKILAEVGMADRMDYYPDRLFGGQRQRGAIARALVSEPSIVLTDEPTAALDNKSGRNVVEIMQRLAKQQGCTILLVTHNTRILDVADRIVHMEDGRLARDTALVGSIA